MHIPDPANDNTFAVWPRATGKAGEGIYVKKIDGERMVEGGRKGGVKGGGGGKFQLQHSSDSIQEQKAF